MNTDIHTPMEEYETEKHDHKESEQCFIVHFVIDREVFDKLSLAEKRYTVLFEADRMKSEFIEHLNKELKL